MKNLPSIVWVFIFIGGIIGFIGGTIGVFYLIAKVEGVASILFLVAGWFMAAGLVRTHHLPGSQLIVGGVIAFYALMGMAVDQAGNPLFNYPLQPLFCPAGTRLNRNVNISHPLPERTDMTQDYRCLDSEGKTVTRISMGYVIGLRFLEYVLVAYLMMGAHSLLRKKPTT